MTKHDFDLKVVELKAGNYQDPILYAIGGRVVTGGEKKIVASVRYPVVNGPGQNTGTAAILMKVFGIKPEGVQIVELDERLGEVLAYYGPFQNDGQYHANIEALKQAQNAINCDRGSIATFIFDDIDPVGVEDSTLKLYGLSCRHFKPNQLNLTKIFTKLPNVTWVGDKPMDVLEVREALMEAAFGGDEFSPHAVDKFPLFCHRLEAAEMGLRICDQHSARLGAYLGEGTTLMPGSYVNFNAGTEGPSMVEGLIASSVIVGAGSDIGNGAKTIGVLSGGNDKPISIGRNCLLELNAVLAISIGDAVIVAAGVSITAGSLVNVRLEKHPLDGSQVKAESLIGINAVTFRRNDEDGLLEVVRTDRNEKFARKLEDGETILNMDLHNNS